MWNSTLLVAALLSLAAALTAAQANSGQTANGCSYKIVNGQYFYNCDAKSPSPQAPQPSAVFQDNALVTEAAPAPMSAAPNMVPASAQAATAPAQTMKVVIAPPPPTQAIRNEAPAPEAAAGNTVTYRNARDQLFDNTYVGASIGSTSIGATSGSGLNLGVNLGTNIDEYMGLEFGYGYANQNLNLNLASRSGTSAPASPFFSGAADDASLSSHMLSAELHYHLTDAFKRLRPYGGIGLGWRKSTLEEKTNSYDYSSGAGELAQSSIGILASLGTKFRLSDTLQAGLAFRYYLPVSKSAATLNSNPNTSGFPSSATSSTRLRSGDADLTGSSQVQILGGLQYLF